MMYLLDANTFIEAKNRFYRQDICPGFWEWLDEITLGDEIKSIEKVYDELAVGNDDLAGWVKARRNEGRFLAVDTDIQNAFRRIVADVNAADYRADAQRKFLAGADPWLVATALAHGATVVTHENHEPQVKRRVPLPNVCRRFNVAFTDLFTLLAGQDVVFVRHG